MAQYFQVTSLEELHKLYPNLQLENLEGIPCMIQEDQVTQYTDGQGQQVIATIEQTGMQLSHNAGQSQQCTSPQSQFVVHQPTQYVIQQMDTSESQTSTVQYIQQRQPSDTNKEEIPVVQFRDQSLSCIGTDIGNDNSISTQQCTVKQEGGQQQYLPQVQPVLQHPIQLHQHIQAVDVAGNIVVLQNQDQQEIVLNHTQKQEVISNPSEKHPQQQEHPQHILIQRHPQQKPAHIISQKQISNKTEDSRDCVQQQILQSGHVSQGGSQQQQIIHQAQQQIIQPLQYFNQVTVIDSFSQPRAVTIEHHPASSENIGQKQHQIQAQIHQYRPKKTVQQTNLSTIIQHPQVLVPQRFEMSSPPHSSSISQTKKKVLSQDFETTQSPVFIVQKVDNPFLIRQHQTKMRFQNAISNSDKINDTSYQSISTQSEEITEHLTQENQQLIQTSSSSLQQNETHQKMNVAGQVSQLQGSKCSPEKSPSYGQIKIGIVEQPIETGSPDQINKLKVGTARASVCKIKTVEQQTETSAISEDKETGVQQFQRFTTSESQPRLVPGVSCQMQSPVEIPNQFQIPSRGRGVRGPSPRGYHYVSRGRGMQVPSSSPRLSHVDRGGISKKVKSPRGGRGGRGGWTSNASDQRQVPLVRSGVQPVATNSGSKGETTHSSNEVMEEARMVVLLINGEKKIVRIPCSQNILLGQILQQAGISLASPTPITVEQVGDNNFEHLIIKNSPSGNQQLAIGLKSSNTSQVVGLPTSPGTSRSIVATVQQRPRGQLSYSPQASSVGIIRHRLHFVSPRMPSPSFSGSVTSGIGSENPSSQTQSTQNSTLTSTPSKEEPRFISGFMAICPFCGISSLDFNKCIRCRRKLPENVKSQSIFSVKKKKEKASGGSDKVEDCRSDSDEKQSDLCSSEEKDKTSLPGCDKKKPKPYIKRKKISDEPAEILILSSDDEEESKVKKSGLSASALSGLKKEPVYTDVLSKIEMNNSLKENNLNEEFMKNVQPGCFTTLQCRTIRIGSYKVTPKERVFLSSRGIRMVINSLKNENTTIIIPTIDILKVLIHFGKQMPVIFLYPLPKIGAHIRDLLGMDNKMGPYYDPTSSQEETHKRITLLLEKITEDNKIAINKIFGQEKLEELSEKEANEILIRASPVEIQNPALGKPSDDVKKIMIYPPPPEKGGITLNNQDYACLGEDQFLNDVIIDFYLKYLMLKVLSPVDRNRTHVFSTFFYKRLTTKPKTLRKNDPENDPKLSPAEKRHMRVKGWTKQVNLFEKDFVIVPINEHSHWFLAIICFPGLSGPVRFADNTPVEPEEITPKKSTETVQIGNTTITHIIKTDGSTVSLEMDSGSDRDEAEGDQDDLHPSSDDEGGEQVEEETNSSQPVQIPLLTPTQPQVVVKESRSKLIKRKSFKEPIKQPCILIFDSLAGASRVRVVATLRDYLKIEYKKKMGQERDFSKDTIKGAVPKVPQQNNFTDCGLYVLQYVESFFQDPLHDFKLPLKYLQDWFPEEIVSSKRQKLASLIRDLMEEQGIKVEDIGLPVLTFTNGSNAEDDHPQIEDEDVDDEDELNEEEEEMLRNRVQISGFDNEDDEDLNLEEEDEIEDEEDEDEEEEEVDFEYDEELEVGRIPSQWLSRTSGCCSELQPSVKTVFKTNALVEYDPSDSEEEGEIPQNSIILNKNQMSVSVKSPEVRESDQSKSLENRKTVPLTEFQDFESQISCTTIERNLDEKNNDSNMIFSEEVVAEEQCTGLADEEESSFETSQSSEVVTDSLNQSFVKKACRPNEVLVKDDNNSMEVTNIIKKLVNDKNITISRKEDELNSSLFRKHSDVKKFKVKDCDKGEEVEKSLSSPPKTNIATYKRPYQTLKSVRIPKKTERNLELCSKRQKVDER